ncbi:MAG: GatB/YqeY domain-containing protein [Microgenomates group bacterium]|jgi:hypothetical protein
MLLDQLHEDLKQAQLDKNEPGVNTLRLLLSEIKNSEIKKSEELSDEEIVTVIQREIKKRKEAAMGFRQGNREESAIKEEQEADLLAKYLPAQLSDMELSQIIDEVIAETGAIGMTDMGKVIGLVMGKVKGSAEGSKISEIVKNKLIQKAA